MTLDCSRFTFNSWHDYLGVVMQQGRVQLDADWNELVSQMVRRIQAGTLDTFGQTVVPRVTPDGFRIAAGAGTLTIGVGRMYVDGILAENHGAGALQWDPLLAEQVGGAAVDYMQQPYYPSPPALPAGGPCLVYLDVWQRELTCLQDPDLVEKAVGVDATARLQTVWQVKVHPTPVGNAQCATPDQDIPGWPDVKLASGARLTTAYGNVAGAPNPCLVPPSGGYKGLENQLYRVEIHDGGTAGTASFKWSRDNATVQSLVTQINAARDRLVVDSVGRDELLRFSDGDWVEITDDVRELRGDPGIVRRIKLGNGVNDDTRTIVLADALPAGQFPADAQDRTEPARHTRIRRWDQTGKILRADGTVFHDLEAAGANGLIPVPPAGASVFLEDGILVSFDLDGSAGRFHVGDHWSFAARSADATFEILNRAPPRGIHHHYARLALVTFPDAETDCRVLWPPATAAAGECGCDACVTADAHNQGSATIQHAIDKLRLTGGVICLGAGVYRLRDPLRIEGATALRIRGKGTRTLLLGEGSGELITIQASENIVLEQFVAAGAVDRVVVSRNNSNLALDHLYLYALALQDRAGVGVLFDGHVIGARIRDCAITAGTGIVGGDDRETRLLSAQLFITDNLFVCRRSGVHFGKRALHYGETVIARNLILGPREAGIAAQGGALPGAAFRIDANSLHVQGHGVVAAIDGLRIADNEIRGSGEQAEDKLRGRGIVLAAGLDRAGIGSVWIVGNRLSDLAGPGIEVLVPLGAAGIERNVIQRAHAGIVFGGARASEHVSIENNELRDIGSGDPDTGTLAAIQVAGIRDVDIVGNVVASFAPDATRAMGRSAILAIACANIRISGNRLSDLGPKQEFIAYVAGIEIQAPYSRATVSENTVINDQAAVAVEVPLQWQAIRILFDDGQNFHRGAGVITAYAGARAFVLTRAGLQVLAMAPPRHLALRGNQGAAGLIGNPMVVAFGPTDCHFSDNHFEAATRGIRGALVELNAETVIASNNRLRWLNNDMAALNIRKARAFTVLGNITMGPIEIDGQPLPAPWEPFNLQS